MSRLFPTFVAICLTIGASSCSNMLGYDDVRFEGRPGLGAAGGAGRDSGTGGVGGFVDAGGAGAGSTEGSGGWPGIGGTGGDAGAAGVAGGAGAGGAAGTTGTGGTTQTGGTGGESGAAGYAGSGGDAGSGGTGTGGGPLFPPELDLNNVVWLHKNVSSWPVTVNLSSVTFSGGLICLNHDIASKNWPIGSTGSTDVVANPWVFIYHNDQWYGATWEWLRPPGQTCKNMSSVAGDHIKVAPFDAASGWTPSSGETLYFMVSGIARYGTPNVQERSEPIRVVWP